MSGKAPAQVKPTSSVSGSGHHGRKNRGGRTRGRSEPPKSPAHTEATDSSQTASVTKIEDIAVCWICAEPVKFYSLSECNHRTCHVCALRLRALYKRMDCTFCKHPQLTLIFTESPDNLFETYTPERIPFKDSKLTIFFETQEMMEETLILLRFNCPDASCDFIASGWGDLKMHVRATHGKSMCDLCIRFKKIFAHEHVLYQPGQLPLHLPSIPHRASQRKNTTQENVEGGVHPVCEFCQECFFSDDELFVHMRERHEECFVCKRAGIKDQYFLDYNSLERHFNAAHFPCKNIQCQAQKFVVFGSALDLKAHMIEQHGGDMTTRDRKDARKIDTDFEYDTGGGGNRRHGRNRTREREREPPEPGPSRNRRREGFGATLTSEASDLPTTTQSLQPESQERPGASVVEPDPVTAARHAVFLTRVNALTSNSTTAVSAIKVAIRSYRSSESGPRDLISTIFNVVDRDLDSTASLMSALVELLDDEDKRRALLASWNGFKLEHQRQFPDLTSSTQGSEYAGVAGGRVLNVKHSAAVRSSSNQTARQVWDRVAQAAASSSTSGSPAGSIIRPQDRFPALRPSQPFRQTQHNTAWSGAGASSSSRPTSASPAPSSKPQTAPPQISAALFPTLPSSSANTHTRPVVSGNQSLKHILGEAQVPSGNVWGTKKTESPNMPPDPEYGPDHPGDHNPGGRKKKKGKEKQTLFTLGSFPT